MIKYNTEKLTNELLLTAIAKWVKKGWIKAEFVKELSAEKSYVKNHLLKRIGLFVATFLSIWGVIGFFSLFLAQLANSGLGFIGFLLMAYGAGLLVFLEKMIEEKQWYKQGTDDAFLFNAIFLLFTGILLIIEPDFNQAWFLVGSILLVIIITMVSYRYLNWFYAVIAILLINSIPIQILALINTQLLFFAALVLIPLNIMILKLVKKYETFDNYVFINCFKYIKYVACVMMYLSVNLYVIKESAYQLLSVNEIPLQGLFLTLTIIFPVLFIALGLYFKQKFMLHSGLFLLIPTVVTIRAYYAVLPIELSLTLGGLVLILVSYFSIKQIQKNNTPFTFEANEEEDLSNAELLIMAQQFGPKYTETPSDKTFGGGTFGGAGAEGSF
jgi:hypothetical protein